MEPREGEERPAWLEGFTVTFGAVYRRKPPMVTIPVQVIAGYVDQNYIEAFVIGDPNLIWTGTSQEFSEQFEKE